MEDIVRFVNVFSAGLVAGGTAVVLVVLLPAIHQLAGPEGLRLHQVVTPLFYRYQPAGTVISGVSALLALAIDFNLASLQGLATLGGLICTVGVAAVSFAFSMPMNSVIAGWASDPVPPEYAGLRVRWNRAHAARTILAVTAFGLYLAAALAG